MKWETVQACPLCGDNNATYYGQGHAPLVSDPAILGGATLAVVTTYGICNSCGLIFQIGRLDEESGLEFYQSGLYRSTLNRTQEELDESERRTAERIAPYVGSGSHLDIGCSRGYLLAATRQKGCTVFGVEPFAEYVTEDVPTVGSLDDVVAQYDNVTCIHVLEHVIDPVEYAKKIMATVKPGGKLVLEVPSDMSPGGPLRLAHYYHYQPPVIRRLFAGMIFEQFELTPHNLFVMRKPK